MTTRLLVLADTEGVSVAMIHDTEARAGRERRARKWFPEAVGRATSP